MTEIRQRRARGLARIGKWIAGTGLGLSAILTAVVWHPYVAVLPLSRRYRDVLFFVPTEEKVVALSIDDGPSAATDQILATLRANDAKATFFIIGRNAAQRPDAIERIDSSGHEIGNHLFTDRVSARLSKSDFARELAATDSIIRKYQVPRWFRPGSGWYTESMLTTAKHFGYQCVLGSVYPFDPQVPWTWYTRRAILHALRPGAIIVLHDGEERGVRTAKVLAELLPSLRKLGYRIVSVGDLVAMSATARE